MRTENVEWFFVQTFLTTLSVTASRKRCQAGGSCRVQLAVNGGAASGCFFGHRWGSLWLRAAVGATPCWRAPAAERQGVLWRSNVIKLSCTQFLHWDPLSPFHLHWSQLISIDLPQLFTSFACQNYLCRFCRWWRLAAGQAARASQQQHLVQRRSYAQTPCLLWLCQTCVTPSIVRICTSRMVEHLTCLDDVYLCLVYWLRHCMILLSFHGSLRQNRRGKQMQNVQTKN